VIHEAVYQRPWVITVGPRDPVCGCISYQNYKSTQDLAYPALFTGMPPSPTHLTSWPSWCWVPVVTRGLLHNRDNTRSSPHLSMVTLGCLDGGDKRGRGQGCYLRWLGKRLGMDTTSRVELFRETMPQLARWQLSRSQQTFNRGSKHEKKWLSRALDTTSQGVFS